MTEEKDTNRDETSLLKIIGALKKPKEEEKKPELQPVEKARSPPEGAAPADLGALIRRINVQRSDGQHTEAPEGSGEPGPVAGSAGKSPVPADHVPADETLPLTGPDKLQQAPKQPDTRDVRDSLGKIMADIGARKQAAGSSSRQDQDQKSAVQGKEEPLPAAAPPDSQGDASSAPAIIEMPSTVPGPTEAEEKIISVDQISDLSGLILPKSATFKIEELKLHGRVNVYEGRGAGILPPEINEIWQREFSTAGFKDLDFEAELIKEKKLRQISAKKFGLSNLFKVIRHEVEEYNPKIHGPLLDLTFQQKPGLEEIEVYPVNEPYAYVRIIYDHATHEYTYQVIEPILTEPEKDLLKELKERLFETLDINTKDISKDEARLKLRGAADEIMIDYGIRLTPVQREKILYNMHKDFLGDGLIDAIMHDKYIEDISCDGVNTLIFAYHSSYESMKTTLTYHSAEELDSFVTKLAQRAGKYISIAEPILDATMGDGSRIQMTLGQEVTAHGSTFTIRKFKDEPITPTDLIEWHTFVPLSIAYIWLCVENGKSAIFAGGTASGKTTSLNAIALFIPPMAKIVSLEDTREIKLPHPNWIPSVTRDSFDAAGRGEINMYELLRAAMRQRPEYIIVGEVRGKECQTLFQAMSTGHTTYSTTHADSVSSVVHRIENPPMDVPRNMLSALDFICIQVQARVGGKRIRRNKQIIEILDIDPRTNELITNEVFKWRSATDEISYSGKSYLLEEIMEAKGWSDNRMREELKRRQEVLEWMRIKKIRHYKDVAKILISYHRDPETVIEKVRKDLYE